MVEAGGMAGIEKSVYTAAPSKLLNLMSAFQELRKLTVVLPRPLRSRMTQTGSSRASPLGSFIEEITPAGIVPAGISASSRLRLLHSPLHLFDDLVDGRRAP